MKIRAGFVSNSSSSSFLVTWDKRVTCLADVEDFISPPSSAKRIYEMINEQKGVLLCSPPQERCELCKHRFECYTNRGLLESVLRLIYSDCDDMEELMEGVDSMYAKNVEDFIENNRDKIMYCFSICDSGDEIETEMRARGTALFGELSCLDIT